MAEYEQDPDAALIDEFVRRKVLGASAHTVADEKFESGELDVTDLWDLLDEAVHRLARLEQQHPGRSASEVP